MTGGVSENTSITRLQKVLLAAAGIVLALAVSEVVIRFTDTDMRLLRKTLYYECAFLPLHRTSVDAERLYETVPGAILKGVKEVNPKETSYRSMDITINSLGFRNREFAAAKTKGVFRIIIFGGSNTFGAAVGDDDTYPAQLQKLFDEKYPGRVEVWNAGICAYVISQDVAYSREVVKKYDPDMVIFQDTNVGRRAFLYSTTTADIKRLLAKNRELYDENLPPFWQNSPPLAHRVHYVLARSSALYRTLCVGVYSWLGTFNRNDPVNPVTDKYSFFWYYYGQSISEREFNLFTGQLQGRRIALFYINGDSRQNNMPDITMRDNMTVFSLDPSGRPPEYGEIHPPSYVYRWYARELFGFITAGVAAGTAD